MRRFVLMLVLAITWLSFASTRKASAQYPQRYPGGLPYNQPAYSPYLNLLRGGNTAQLNYFGLVRPELRFRNSVQTLQQQYNTLSVRQQAQAQAAQSGAPLSASTLPATGHPAQFLNYSHYFGGRAR